MFRQDSFFEESATSHVTSNHFPSDRRHVLRRFLQRKSAGTFALWLASAAALTLSAAGQSTTTTLALTAGGVPVTTATPGTLITLTANVLSGSVPVTSGTVNFCNADALLCTDINLIGTAQLTPTGTTKIMIHPGFGSHSYVAMYLGTPNGTSPYTASVSSPITLSSATRASNSTSLEASGLAGDYTLTGTVAASGGVPSPTGTVSFVDITDGNTVLASGPLAFGTQGLNVNQSAELAAPSNTSYSAVAAGDFNGDGNPDLAIVDSGNQIVLVSLGNGDGTFTAVAATSATGIGPRAIAGGDLNNDGQLDIAVANSGDKTVTVLLGNGDGTFVPAPQSPATGLGASAIAVADFNRDGRLDLAVVNSDSRTVTVLLGNGDGSFTLGAQSPATGTDPASIAVGDFNGDGIADFATESYDDNTVSLWLGNGDGSFTAALKSPFSVSMPTGVAAGDLNADGKLDLAVSETNNQLTILVGDGSGSFTPVITPLSSATDRSSVSTGDFNVDGIADLAIEYPYFTKIAIGNGDSTFKSVLDISTLARTQYQAVADFNRDDVVDVAVAHTVCDMSACPAGVTVSLTALSQTAFATVAGIAVTGSGTHEVQASYGGDAVFAPSVSSTIALTATTPAALPLFTPAGGTYTAAQTVTITDASTGVTIYYTTDGSTPTTSSTVYTAPITVSTSTTLKAIAYGNGFSVSPVASATYNIGGATYLISATSLTLTAGESGSSTVTLNASNGYTGTVSLSCSVVSSPAGAIHPPLCASSQTITLSSSVTSGTATIQVTTTPATTTSAVVSPKVTNRTGWVLGGSGAALAFMVFICLPRTRRRWWTSLSAFLVAGIFGGMLACGGSNPSNSSAQTTSDPGTTAGAYTILVSATGNDAAKTAASTTFTLTIR